MHQLYILTIGKTEELLRAGYQVVEFWECDYDKRYKEDPDLAWAAVCSKAVVLLLLTFCLLLLLLWESVIVLCIVVRCFMSILVLQSF